MKPKSLLLLFSFLLLSSPLSAAVNLTQPPRPQIQVSAVPNPVRVNQEVTVTVSIFIPPPCGWQISYGDGASGSDLSKCDAVTGSVCIYVRKISYQKPGKYLISVKAKDPACEKQYQISPGRTEVSVEGAPPGTEVDQPSGRVRPTTPIAPPVADTLPPAAAPPPAPPPIHWPEALPAGIVGNPYNYLVKISGGSAPNTFSLSGGSLPSGLKLEGNGLISGTPAAAGRVPLVLQVRSGRILSRKNYLLEITAPLVQVHAIPPAFTIPRTGGLKETAYKFTCGSNCNLPVSSDLGYFMAGGETLETVGTTLQGVIRNGSGQVRETVTIPAHLVEKVLSRKTNQFSYRRVFNQNLMVVVSFQILAPVSVLGIRHLSIYFENRRPEITVGRNAPKLLAFAEIGTIGSGLLQGYWTVDGRILGYVNQMVTSGEMITLKSPETPPLPTFEVGSHQVQLVLTTPVPPVALPRAVYFVAAREYQETPSLQLVSPENNSELDYTPLTFTWKKAPQVQRYLVEAFLEEGEKPVFSAYARDPDYRISSPGLVLFEPGRKYRWRVQGFDEENRLIARSAFSGFTFSDQPLFRKGLVLLGFEDTPEGLERIEEVSRRYSLRLLEAQEIKTLRLRLALFQTETEIFGLLEALKDEKGVVFQQPDYIFRTMAEPQADLQKVNKLLNLTQVHERHRGRGITVAVVDTGVDLAHRDLKDRIAGSGNFISDSPYQGEIHGTAVAGIIGAGTNHFGMEGIAPQAGILALRACRQVSAARPEGECFSSTLARALDQGIEQKARVVNLSFGAGLADPLLSRLIDAGSKRNILFVAPVGNRPGLKDPTFPASHPAVVGVGGFDEEGRPYPNAAVAAKARVSAPATGIFTTIPGDKHNFLNGTSMSSAIVSGILALAVGEKGNLNQSMLPRFRGDLCRWQEELLSIQVCGQ